MLFSSLSKEPNDAYMVVGLGNPGEEYAQTRHNVGFRTIDKLDAESRGGVWKSQKGALVKETRLGNHDVILVKPLSFMNLSGKPVSQLLKEKHIAPDHLVVIHDDLDLPEGALRIKTAGGHGGHNGIRSLIDLLGTRDFTRIKIGVGRPPGKMDPARYVLEVPRKDAQELLDQSESEAADAVCAILNDGVAQAQQQFNTRG